MAEYHAEADGRIVYPSGTVRTDVHALLFGLPVPHEVLEAMGFSGAYYEENVARSPAYVISRERYQEVVTGVFGVPRSRAVILNVPRADFPLDLEELLGIPEDDPTPPSSRPMVLQVGFPSPSIVHECTHLLRSEYQLQPLPALGGLEEYENVLARTLAPSEIEADLHEMLYRTMTSHRPNFRGGVISKWEFAFQNEPMLRQTLCSPIVAGWIFMWDEMHSILRGKSLTPGRMDAVLRDKGRIIQRVRDRYIDGPMVLFIHAFAKDAAMEHRMRLRYYGPLPPEWTDRKKPITFPTGFPPEDWIPNYILREIDEWWMRRERS